MLERSLPETGRTLEADGATWSSLMRPFLDRWEPLFSGILRPIRLPRHPWLMARFGLLALQSSDALARRFHGVPARALFGGCAAHSILPLDAARFRVVRPGAGAGGTRDRLAVREGRIGTDRGSAGIIREIEAAARFRPTITVRSLDDLPPVTCSAVRCHAGQLERIAGDCALARRIGDGFGDFATARARSRSITPSRSRFPGARRRAGVRAQFTWAARTRRSRDLKRRQCGQGQRAPFVLVAQQSLFDATRAPDGRHTGWAYCHVPNGCDVDMTDRIERQIERYAPGFRDVMLARHVMPPAALEAHNPNLIGGDVGGGSNALDQVLARPVPRWDPYTTSNPRLYLCSASTPPGGGVHGMCGYWAARSVLRRTFQRPVPPELDLDLQWARHSCSVLRSSGAAVLQ